MNLIDVNNIDCTKLPKKLYPYMKDILDFFDVQPTIDAIPKDQYENRLKADLEAILVELQLEIKEIQSLEGECDYAIDECIYKYKVTDLIQEKINELKGKS